LACAYDTRVRAVVLDADGRPRLADLPEPEPSLEVLACGLCGSDVEKLGRAAAGTVLGHEIAGRLENGDRVTVLHHVSCGSCGRCRSGHESTCEAFGALRIAPGGFAERLRATHCVPLPDSIDEDAAVWVEPVACVLRAAELVPPGPALVVGCGSIGQLWVQVLVGMGNEVGAADVREDRAARAVELGAVPAAGLFSSAVVTAPEGIDDALSLLGPGGTVILFAARDHPMPVTLDLVYRKELVVIGSRSATPDSFDRAIDLLPSLVLPTVTTLPLERFSEGVELYRRGEAMKVVFTP
jgi:L-iditol 2-dehydrogenase